MKPRKWDALLVSAYLVICVSALVTLCKCDNSPSQPVNTQDYCRSVGRALGRCVPLQDCSSFSRWLKERPIIKQNVKNIVKFTCYFDLQQPKVCCPLSEIGGNDDDATSYNLIQDHSGLTNKGKPSQNRQSQNERLVFPEDVGHNSSTRNNVATTTGRDLRSGLSLLPSLEECGSSVKLSRHVGTFGAYPWIALLGNKDLITGKFIHICSGTLLNSKYVLTSAHCHNKISGYPITHVRLGEYDLQTQVDRGSPFLPNSMFEEYAIQKTIIHPNYAKRSGKEGDISLIRLVGSVPYSAYIRPVCLPFRDYYGISQYWGVAEEPSLLKEGKLLVAGWGRLHSNSTGYSTLQDAQVKITPDDECRDFGYNVFSPGTQYCLGGNYRQSLCLTDDGGALLLPMRLGSKITARLTPKVFQMGIFSKGPSATQCLAWEGVDHRLVFLRHNRVRSALPQNVPKPSIYTKLIPYLDWILGQLES